MQLTSKKEYIHEIIYMRVNDFYDYKNSLKKFEYKIKNSQHEFSNQAIVRIGAVFLNNDILRMDIYVEKH